MERRAAWPRPRSRGTITVSYTTRQDTIHKRLRAALMDFRDMNAEAFVARYELEATQEASAFM